MSQSIRWPALGVLLGLCAAWAMWGGHTSSTPTAPLSASGNLAQAPDVPTALTRSDDGGQRVDTTKQHGATALKFDPEFADFGDVPVNESRTLNIAVANPSAKPITLSDLRPSCGCLHVEAPELTVQPGKTIQLRLNIAALPGKKKEVLNLYFRTDERAENICSIEVHIHVKEEIIVEANVLAFQHLNKNEERVLETTVSSADGKPFQIKSVACQRPEFTFKWDPIEGQAAYKLFVTLKSDKGGLTAETVGIVTDRARSGTAPLNLSGTIKADLLCTPAIMLGQANDKREVGALTTVMKRTSPGRLEILDVTEASRPPQNLPLEFIVDRLDESSCRLTIKFKTPYPPRQPFGQFLIKTNVEEESFRLPFRVNGILGTMQAAPLPVPAPAVPSAK